MAFFDQMFGAGAAPTIGGGAPSAFSPSGNPSAGGLSPQIMAVLASLQNRSTPGAAAPQAAPQMPAPPSGSAGGPMGALGNPAALSALAAQHGMPGGATATPGGGNLMQTLMANPQLLKMVSQGKGGPGGSPIGGIIQNSNGNQDFWGGR